MNHTLIPLGMSLILGILAQANAHPSDQAAARAKQLKAGIETFRLELLYNGEEGKPFYRLILSVPPIGQDRSSPFYRIAQVSADQAEKIIDHLATEGFLDKAEDLKVKRQRPMPNTPGYTLAVTTEERAFREDLGWGLSMLKRLDSLKKVLDGDAAKGMDFLLGRLSGWRKLWEKEAAESTELKADPEKSFATPTAKSWILGVLGDGWAIEVEIPQKVSETPMNEAIRPLRCRFCRGPEMAKYIKPPAGPATPPIPKTPDYSVHDVTDLTVRIVKHNPKPEPDGYFDVVLSRFTADGKTFNSVGPVQLKFRGPYP